MTLRAFDMANHDPRRDADVKAAVQQALRDAVWAASSVLLVPNLVIERWRIFRADGFDHIVGWNATEWEGRVSSAISTFSPHDRRAITKSGRVYMLEGPSGSDPRGMQVFSLWTGARQPKSLQDVTEEYESRLARPA